ncbi:hypothetical protein VNO78_14304 [Psophocarpus tetragonolobus]|uniref:Uncharacterized protein n=1 Tax=Psophocarpus tetragonolobus TaxID=3891 RepID=A0AAN9XQ02_PSOTE
MSQSHIRMDDTPCFVSVSAFSASRRRLSACFVERSRPVSSEKPMARISLQGRLLNADQASSARAIGGGFSAELALAWNLFPPIYRFLVVAVIGASVARARKDLQLFHLMKSVELRDQVLLSMQQKLDSLCELVSSNSKEHSINNKSREKDGELQLNERIKFVECGCWHCEEHCAFFNEVMAAPVRRSSTANEVLQYKTPFSNEDQEERRMSDMSDWASSVTSSADIQLNSLAVEQDIYNLRRDCEKKDTTIKELTTLLNSNEVAKCQDSKVVQLTRLHRPSFSASGSNDSPLPHMIDNLIYDMESATSPSSSSDSDSSSVIKAPNLPADVVLKQDSASKIDQKPTLARISSSSGKRHSKSRSFSPRKEVSSSRKSTASSSAQKQLSARGDLKKSRRRSLNGDSATAHKRWV